MLLLGLVLLVPLVFTTGNEVVQADRRLTAARSATDSAERLAALLRLTPAISAENNASVSLMGAQEIVPASIPPFLLASMGLDFENTVRESREVVDGLMAELGDPEWILQLQRLREQVEGTEIEQTFDGFTQLASQVELAIDEELASLSSAAVASGQGGDLISAARVAEATASVQVIQAGQIPRWAALVAPLNAPDTLQLFQLSDSVAQMRSASDTLDVVAAGTEVGQDWQRIQTSEENVRLQDRFEETVSTLAMQGARDPAVEVPLFADDIDFDEVTEAIGVIGSAIGDSDVVAVEYVQLVDTALAEVEGAAETAVANARADRTRTFAWVAGFGVVLLLAGTVLFNVIVGPVRRMEEVAGSLRDGQLDKTVDNRGPRELRVAANVLNEAVASVRLAESQAAALASERLDDPVLDQSVAGRLGVSLQRAVTRLTQSLAEREEFQQKLRHESTHDGLTHLPNRRAIMAHLQDALWRLSKDDTSIALLFIDLDGFREINEHHGHHVGDKVLQVLSTRLDDASRDTDMVGRLGGDEFVVIAQDFGQIDNAVVVAKRLGEILNEPITVTGVTITANASIGVAFADDAATTAEELFRDADLAVSRAKQSGRGGVEVCDEELRQQQLDQAQMEEAIKTAIAIDEFDIAYQPVVDTRTGAVISLEALIRWDQPGVGFVSPADFIPVAERSDLIVHLDRWVLNAVARQVARWQAHPGLSGIPVAVNISGRHVGNGTLARDVRNVLDAHTIEASSLVVEVTETAVLSDERSAAQQLTSLRAMGVRIALDDFGTGYMSLAHLRSLPVDVLKIDRSFVSKMEEATDHSLVQLMVDTGHLLGLDVTAEGVETEAESAALAEIGADALQGFLLCRPINSEELERRLQGRTALSGPLAVVEG